jgi:nitrile hydratase accessory protein
LTQPEAQRGSDRVISISDMPRLPKDEAGPIFDEPWQAQAFALVCQLNKSGYFTLREWSAALGTELGGAALRGEADDGSNYYNYWLAALEKLVVVKGLTDPTALSCRREEWLSAYRATPHGQPVNLPT